MGNSAYLDWILAAICFFLAVLFFIGKGQKLLDAFSGKKTKHRRWMKRRTENISAESAYSF
jgi:hypothetical protein